MNQNDKDVLLEQMYLGQEVDSFVNSTVGQYVLGRAEDEYNSAIMTLKDCDPNDVKKIMKLQSDIKRAEGFRDWLSEAILAGLQATEILEERGE